MTLARLIRLGGLFLLVAGIAALGYRLSVPKEPAKVVRRISATACFEQPMGTGLPGVLAQWRRGSFTPLETEGMGPRTATHSSRLYCPIPSDSLLPHQNIDLVVLHGWGSSLCSGPSTCPPYVLAYLCLSYESVADGECTRFLRSEVRGGNYEIKFQGAFLDPWRNNPNGYPYIVVQLPPPSFDGDTNTLRGITISGSSNGHR